MTRPLDSTPLRLVAPLIGACALALAAAASPAWAAMQFNGDTGRDLTVNGTSGNTNSNAAAAPLGGNTNSYGPEDSYDDVGADGAGTTRLRQPEQRQAGSRGDQPEPRATQRRQVAPPPTEFELYVQQHLRRQATPSSLLQSQAEYRQQDPLQIRRFGADLLTDPAGTTSAVQDPLPSVPGDYIIRPGDEVVLTIWGTVDANLRLIVDREGRIAVPRIGSVTVAGLRNADLADTLTRRVAQTFKNFQLTATLGQVRAIRVFVTGYAQRPGSITVNGLASLLHAIMRAGGPSAAGSFRDIRLQRGGREVGRFDLYDLLLKGDRATDRLVQPDDVIFIGPLGPQVAMLGSVNQPAIFELKPGETLADVIGMAGGFSSVADRGRVTIEKLADRASGRVSELTLPGHASDTLSTGDLVSVFSAVSAALPKDRQNKRIRVEGEVVHPGDYVMPPGTGVAEALQAAGGLTSAAYPYGTEFTRESVRQTQEINYERALRDLETDMSRTQASQRVTSTEELSTQASSAAANARLLERLRQVRPSGRVVLQIAPEATSLPNLALEDGDTLSIPSRGTAVGVFGSVFTTGSFIFEANHTTTDYLNLAGGPTRGADTKSIFMIRANGSVISANQGRSFWHASDTFSGTTVLPGDTIFVPEEIDKSTFIQDAKDWTQILYQFGLGLAGIKSLGL